MNRDWTNRDGTNRDWTNRDGANRDWMNRGTAQPVPGAKGCGTGKGPCSGPGTVCGTAGIQYHHGHNLEHSPGCNVPVAKLACQSRARPVAGASAGSRRLGRGRWTLAGG
ncbi:hypothetical protein GRJ2_002202400 [Grus japonensis]|uniref:Uncharacterized protein n=1 Tax=Grus japonensis TaxID=30415 RepID=A0ABC9XIQ3_GRUJA